jgi:hypothetical protein
MYLGAILAIGAAVVGLAAMRQSQGSVIDACAEHFEPYKTQLIGYHWTWFPPGWTCEFVDTDRHLPL